MTVHVYMRTFIITVLLAAFGWNASIAGAQSNADIWLHPKAAPLDVPMGPFVRLGANHFLTVDEHHALVSRDNGKTWKKHRLFEDNSKHVVRPERALIRTRDGTIILAFMNDAERDWRWDSSIGDAREGTRLPTWAIRSLDDGETWQDLQMLHPEWTGAIRNMIQTPSGAIVFTSMMLLHNPGRHATVTYRSADDGVTWQRSNILDLGGAGHHDGAIEATIEVLSDGRLWMLMRTNWDRFWQAYSEDDGRYWRTIKPADIDASSAPGLLLRLHSGRLALVWNRLLPEGHDTFPRRGGDREWSEEPAINHRWEMSIAFSETDGRTWSKPVVFARAEESMRRRDISYPYVFEPRPGELWITSMRGGLRTRLNETDFAVNH
jgi:sialidase-1